MSLDKEIKRTYKESYLKCKVYGVEFDPITAYQEAYKTMPSGRLLIDAGYCKYMDTKMLLAYLGMKEAEAEAIRTQKTTAQKRINELFGYTLQMYLYWLNEER